MFRLLLSILILSFSLAFPPESQAQKKRSKNEVKNEREAEFYFTEGEKYFILEDYAKALVLFEQSKELSPDKAAIYYKIAEIYEHNDELDKALNNINQALKLEDDNKYYFLLAANVQTRLGNFKDAAAVYEKMIGKISNTQHYLLELAAIYLYQDRLDKALETYQRAEDHFGINQDIIKQKQKILIEQDNITAAIEEGKKLIEYEPENEAAVVSQAELLMSNNREEEALAFLQKHLQNFPDQALVSMYIGNIYLRLNKAEEAEEYLTTAFNSPLLDVNGKIQILASLRADLSTPHLQELSLQLSQILVNVHSNVADAHSVYGDILLTIGRQKEARGAYLKALKLDDSNFTLWQNVLQLYLQSQDYDSVLLLSENALELFPNQNAVYYYRGLASLRRSNFEEAIPDLNRGKMLSSGDPKLLSAFNAMLGEAYNGLKDHKKSDESFEAALKYDPENPMALNNYSYSLALRKENLEKAAKMAYKLTQKNPGIPNYVDTYAWVLYHQEKYKEAKKVLSPIIESGSAKGTHHNHFGDILFKLGEKSKAVEQWKLAQKKDPSIKNINKKISNQQIYE
jgi:tetratricopeptide (TPR) repeat protein